MADHPGASCRESPAAIGQLLGAAAGRCSRPAATPRPVAAVLRMYPGFVPAAFVAREGVPTPRVHVEQRVRRRDHAGGGRATAGAGVSLAAGRPGNQFLEQAVLRASIVIEGHDANLSGFRVRRQRHLDAAVELLLRTIGAGPDVEGKDAGG